MCHLITGPVLRFAGRDEATVWLETSAACEVEILGRRQRTFHVAGSHYSLVSLTGLPAGTEIPYEVRLDGRRHWPENGSAPPTIRLRASEEPVRIAFGSCRVVAPDSLPWSLRPDDHQRGIGADALAALARVTRTRAARERPDLLLLLGDQVYVDAGAALVDHAESPADDGGPTDLEGIRNLYRASWSEPDVRWLLANVPSAMVLDDHEVHDSWRSSSAWLEDMRSRAWWPERERTALIAYWLYQHLGNLSPAELAADPLLARVRRADDGITALQEAAHRWTRGDGSWSYCRRIGGASLIVLDTRGRRVFADDEVRMLDEPTWSWFGDRLVEGGEHVLLATPLPVALPSGLRDLEALVARLRAGLLGRRVASAALRQRRSLDLEHWPGFPRSLERLAGLLGDTASGRRGKRPNSIILLTGDVHHGSLREVRPAGLASDAAPIWQVVSSPLRNAPPPDLRRKLRLASSPLGAVTTLLARAVGVPAPSIRARQHGPLVFDNHVGLLELRGGLAHVELLRARRTAGPDSLRSVIERRLA